MKSKKIKNISLILLIFISIVGTFFYFYKKNKDTYINEFIKIIENNHEYDLESNEIEFYRTKITESINKSNDNSLLKKGYCTLGYIEFISGNYKKSNEDLFKALKYKSLNKVNINLMIYSGISKNYIALKDLDKSYLYFKKAEDLAKSLNREDDLANMYRARANSLTNFDNGIGESIALLEKAIKLEQTYVNKINNYLMLSKLYMLSNTFDTATKYTMYALNLANKNDNDKLLNQSIITLGTNFFAQEQYSKAINIYEELLKSKKNITIENKLVAIGYIIYCRYELKEYDNIDQYINQYISLANKLSPYKKDKELNWLYILVSEIELKKGNIDEAKKYINMAQEIYYKNEAYMYSNTYIWMEKVKIDINSNLTSSYSKTLSEYKELLNQIKDIGIKSDIYNSIIESIIEFSRKNNDIETLLFYTEKKLEVLESKIKMNLNTSTIYATNKFENDSIKSRVDIMKKRNGFYLMVILLVLIILIIIYRKNQKIKDLNNKLEKTSITDALTTLNNKRYIYKVFEDIYLDKEEITFIIIDVDCFKLYNDNYGHLEGDNVLRQLGITLKDVFYDDIPCRYGGEEFVILSRLDKNDIIPKLDILMKKIYDLNIEHIYSTASDKITVSIGAERMKITTKEDINLLIKLADEKLYISKENGRNQYTL